MKTAIDRKAAPETKVLAKKADAAVPHQAKQNEGAANADLKVVAPVKVADAGQKDAGQKDAGQKDAGQKDVGQKVVGLDAHPRVDPVQAGQGSLADPDLEEWEQARSCE
ncbi:hypothetical protein [Pirellula sp. SH-Sr6A]|uniref:hypothetical protein n=1 Tax=Pirellula sp. SH-Sr6A TaxID=1632865 RepID=UPI00143BE845|nr:hypothetical protein [Pirellula sp. SH-Sr6A]